MAANIVWDFPLESEVLYFDSYKSFELTKYRPINDDEGLDFNPD
jgi:hypothetical protein